MRKLISLALALVMILSLSTVAFAEVTDDYDEFVNKPVALSKTYEVNNGTAPAETFTYKFEGVSYVNGNGETVNDASIPAIADVSIAFDAINTTTTKSVSVSVNPSSYNLGVYTYKVTEVAPTTKTAGVTYSDENLYLVLTILRDEQSNKQYVAALHYANTNGSKEEGFTNEYDAGSLTVTKEITGNMADMSKKFTFTITFAAPQGTAIRSAIASNSAAGNWSEDKLTYTISLGDGESVTLSNIPAGTFYTVSEDAENYVSDGGVFTDATKTIAAGDTDSVTFTNTLDKGIDTGISMDSMPYVLLLAVATMGLAVLFTKKRMMREF